LREKQWLVFEVGTRNPPKPKVWKEKEKKYVEGLFLSQKQTGIQWSLSYGATTSPTTRMAAMYSLGAPEGFL
jgi:hypothetical protein